MKELPAECRDAASADAAPDDHAPATGAAEFLPRWQVGELIAPPTRARLSISNLLGPGILLAGGAIGAGEWLFGPAVTAQYGGTLLWLATISIAVQVIFNIEVMPCRSRRAGADRPRRRAAGSRRPRA